MQDLLLQRCRGAVFQRVMLLVSVGFGLLGLGANPVWFSATFLLQALCLVVRPRTQILGWVLAAVAVSWFLFVGGYEAGNDQAYREHANAVVLRAER